MNQNQSMNRIECTVILGNKELLVALKLFLNAKCSLSWQSKWQIGHGKWFLNTDKFLIKTFLIAMFDCIRLCNGLRSRPVNPPTDFIEGFTAGWSIESGLAENQCHLTNRQWPSRHRATLWVYSQYARRYRLRIF